MSIFSKPHLLNSPRWDGMRVGLLGGSFNPPHEGHVHISVAAMKALELDVVWWLVTPQNPLKKDKAPELAERVRLCDEIAAHPRIIVSDIEQEMGTRITYYSIKKLKRHYPHHEFVWISGMDNAVSLHKWNRWKDLLREIPTVHLTRKPATSLIKQCPLRMYDRQEHVYVNRCGKWPLQPGITYWMLQKKMLNISSTEIRENRFKRQKI